MAAMARTLPASGAALREWDMAEGKLRIVVASPTGPIAGAEIVAALEKTQLLSGAKMITQADPRVMGFSMRLRSLDELNAADPATAAAPGPRGKP